MYDFCSIRGSGGARWQLLCLVLSLPRQSVPNVVPCRKANYRLPPSFNLALALSVIVILFYAKDPRCLPYAADLKAGGISSSFILLI